MKDFNGLPFRRRKKDEDPSVLASQIESLSKQISNGTGGGVLVYNTLTDLQNAYPGGSTQPAWVVSDNEWYYWSGTVIDTTPPTITCSSSGGTFSSAQTVTLSSNETATIYYTLDGSTPTTSSSVYSSALTISSTSSLKFFGKDTAGNSSSVQSVSFTINAPDTTPPIITVSPQGSTFTSSQTVTISINEAGTIYYTTDGTTPTTSSAVYNSPITISSSCTLSILAKDTAGNQATRQDIYTINIATDTTPPVVTASPAAGTYTSAQSVTLISNESATIYYTTDGTTPTTSSTVYSSPITVNATETIQFIGKDTAGNVSTPVAATYTINVSSPSYVNDSSLMLFQATPTIGETLDETSFKYFNGTDNFTVEWTATIQQAGANPAVTFFERGASNNPLQIDFTYQGYWHAKFTGIKADGTTAEYPTIQDPTAHISDLPKSFHVQYVMDRTAGKLYLYVDNVLATSGTVSSGFNITNTTNALQFVVGSSTNLVSVKNLAYYNRALTTTELTQNYNALK